MQAHADIGRLRCVPYPQSVTRTRRRAVLATIVLRLDNAVGVVADKLFAACLDRLGIELIGQELGQGVRNGDGIRIAIACIDRHIAIGDRAEPIVHRGRIAVEPGDLEWIPPGAGREYISPRHPDDGLRCILCHL